jgi:coproporphyrinogen III oxidase
MEHSLVWRQRADLTPHFVFEEDCVFFHSKLKEVCDKHNVSHYPGNLKKWADDYFYIKHQEETRGIGSIFFDQLSENEITTKAKFFDFVKSVSGVFAELYLTIAKRCISYHFQRSDKKWQFVRRGGYVSLTVWDRGFGLDQEGHHQGRF